VMFNELEISPPQSTGYVMMSGSIVVCQSINPRQISADP